MHPSTPAPSPRLLVGPDRPLLDTELDIRLERFEPRTEVTLHASMREPSGRRWGSHATFRTDESGCVDLRRQAPVAGSYQTADPMGLVWSMTPRAGSGPKDGRILPPATLTLTAESRGETVAGTEVERLRLAPEVRRTVIRDRGLVGTLFAPVDGGPHPGVVLIGGSEGGLHELDAALLAARGFAVLALAYFGMRGVPPVLVDLPLEYFGGALAWLRSRGRVRDGRLGVIGGSRGGEAALLIGAMFPEVGAVVSTVGSGLITQGIGMGNGLIDILEQPVASWTWRGRPLPFLRNEVTPELKRQVAAGEPVELRLAFLPGLADREAVAAATIPVERIQGAVLLVSAGDDRMWPCAALSGIAAERLAAAGHRHPFRHLTYPTAGHPVAPPPYGPTTEIISPGPGVRFATGGTPERNAAARADAWAQSVAFLTEHLMP